MNPKPGLTFLTPTAGVSAFGRLGWQGLDWLEGNERRSQVWGAGRGRERCTQEETPGESDDSGYLVGGCRGEGVRRLEGEGDLRVERKVGERSLAPCCWVVRWTIFIVRARQFADGA